MSKLKKQKKILEKNIQMEEDMIKNNKSYTGPNGKTYGPDHYKKAVEYDRGELKKVNQQIERNKKISKLKEIASDVANGAINGVKDNIKNTMAFANKASDAVSEPITNAIKKSKNRTTSRVTKGLAEAGAEAIAGGLASAIENKKKKGGIR